MKLMYRVHCENKGWLELFPAGAVAGTFGEALRLESFEVQLSELEGVSLEYTAHVENKGWLEPVKNGTVCGSVGEGLRIEAIKMILTGELAYQYDVFYRLYVQNKGWMNWAKNGDMSGTENGGLRAEAMQCFIAPAGSVSLSDTTLRFMKKAPIPSPAPEPEQPEPAPTKRYAVVSSDGLWYEPGSPDDYLTEHIQRHEIMCCCGGAHCGDAYFTRMSTQVMVCIEAIRGHLSEKYGVDTPVTCSSALRCYQNNIDEGGVPGSLHTTGEACDIYFSGHMYEDGIEDEIAALSNRYGCSAGIYYDQNFVHIQAGYGAPFTAVWG